MAAVANRLGARGSFLVEPIQSAVKRNPSGAAVMMKAPRETDGEADQGVKPSGDDAILADP